MKRKEVMDLPQAEHKGKLIEFRKELIKLQAQSSTGTAMKNPGLIKLAKKNIARVMTAMNKKKTGSANNA